MSAEALQKVIVESHRGAQNQLANFHSAMDRGNTKAAATALQTAAQAICYGLKNAAEDKCFLDGSGAGSAVTGARFPVHDTPLGSACCPESE